MTETLVPCRVASRSIDETKKGLVDLFAFLRTKIDCIYDDDESDYARVVQLELTDTGTILRLREASVLRQDVSFQERLTKKFGYEFYLSPQDHLKVNELFRSWGDDVEDVLFERFGKFSPDGQVIQTIDQKLNEMGLLAIPSPWHHSMITTLNNFDNELGKLDMCEASMIIRQLKKRGYLKEVNGQRDYTREISYGINHGMMRDTMIEVLFVVNSLIHFPSQDLISRLYLKFGTSYFVGPLERHLFCYRDNKQLDHRVTAKIVEFTYLILDELGPAAVSQYQAIRRMPKLDESRLPSIKRMVDILYDSVKLPKDLAKLVCSYLWRGLPPPLTPRFRVELFGIK